MIADAIAPFPGYTLPQLWTLLVHEPHEPVTNGVHLMAQRVMTMLEARVSADHWTDLQNFWSRMDGDRPAQMVDRYLVQATSDPEIWQAVGVWQSREALDQYRQSVDSPGGVKMFRAVGAEPTLALFDVRS